MPKKVRAPSILGEADALIAGARGLLSPIHQVDIRAAMESAQLPDGLKVLLANNLLADTCLREAHARIMHWLSKQSKASQKAWAEKRNGNGEEKLAADVRRVKAAHPRLGRRAIAAELRNSGGWPYVTEDDVRRVLDADARRKKKSVPWLTPADRRSHTDWERFPPRPLGRPGQ